MRRRGGHTVNAVGAFIPTQQQVIGRDNARQVNGIRRRLITARAAN